MPGFDGLTLLIGLLSAVSCLTSIICLCQVNKKVPDAHEGDT